MSGIVVLTPEAIALCLTMGLPNCYNGTGGITSFNLHEYAIQRGIYDTTGACPITLKGTVVEYCPAPANKFCIVTARFSTPAFPNGVVYLCRDPEQS